MRAINPDEIREELTSVGIKELTTSDEVVKYFTPQTNAILFFNSLCGCAGATARPAICQLLKDHKMETATVFAGTDTDATAKARELFSNYEPSSPSFLFIVNGKAVYQLPRGMIQGYPPSEVVAELAKEIPTYFK